MAWFKSQCSQHRSSPICEARREENKQIFPRLCVLTCSFPSKGVLVGRILVNHWPGVSGEPNHRLAVADQNRLHPWHPSRSGVQGRKSRSPRSSTYCHQPGVSPGTRRHCLPPHTSLDLSLCPPFTTAALSSRGVGKVPMTWGGGL